MATAAHGAVFMLLGFAAANDANGGGGVVGNEGSQTPIRWVGGVAAVLPAPLWDAPGVSDDGSMTSMQALWE
jgi:hypothetical protein